MKFDKMAKRAEEERTEDLEQEYKETSEGEGKRKKRTENLGQGEDRKARK